MIFCTLDIIFFLGPFEYCPNIASGIIRGVCLCVAWLAHCKIIQIFCFLKIQDIVKVFKQYLKINVQSLPVASLGVCAYKRCYSNTVQILLLA